MPRTYLRVIAALVFFVPAALPCSGADDSQVQLRRLSELIESIARRIPAVVDCSPEVGERRVAISVDDLAPLDALELVAKLNGAKVERRLGRSGTPRYMIVPRKSGLSCSVVRQEPK